MLSVERGNFLIKLQESSATQEKIYALLKELERSGLGVDSGDTAHEVKPTRSAPAPTSVNFILIDRALGELSPGL
jgi:hypothetical protein